MTTRLIIALLAVALMATSCATHKDSLKKQPPAEQQAADAKKEPFALPDVKEENDEILTVTDRKPQPILTQQDRSEQYLILNFENTDIKTIVSTFAELLEFNYILAPGVGGSVTIQSYKRIPKKDMFRIFQSILELNGLTAVQVGGFYHIIPIDQARTYPLKVDTEKEIPFTIDGSFITQLIPLEHVNATDVANNIIRQLMPRGVHLIVYEPANTLILTARPATLEKFMRIIEAIDVSEGERNAQKTFVYYVENGNAKKLQNILKTIYISKNKNTPSATQKTTTSSVRPKANLTKVGGTSSDKGGLPAELGEITITAYDDINALIVKATPRSYLSLLDVLKKIDVPPKQVLIDVMIAEITLNDSLQYGFEWFLQSTSGNLVGVNLGGMATGTGDAATTALPSTVPNPASGFSYGASGTMSTNAFNSLFSAIETYSDLNILASPNILAMDNKEAEIKIGNEIPTATRKTQSSAGGTDVDIQYKTVGTLLTVTPHITEKGKVSMKISVESSSVGGDQLVGTDTYPTFNTRKATTTAVIENNKTLILGGIIYERGGSTRSGIPFLSRIPIIGALFGAHTYTKEKAELILMVTPHVISNTEEALDLTQKYQNRVRTIKKKISLIRNNNKDEDKDKDEKTDGDEETQPEEDKSTSAPELPFSGELN